jgi:hypothetical protein
MAEKSWIAEMHHIIKEKNGAITEADEQHLREIMKIPNDDISVEEVEFKRYRSYL